MLENSLPKLKILVIEDNALVADAICDLVRDSGCDVAGPVGCLQHGFQFLSDRTVDGAIVDIDLHGSGSFPICDELRRRNVPLFFLSGDATPTDVPSQFRKAKFLTKPLDAGEFKTALAEIRIVPPYEAPPRHWGNRLLDSLDKSVARQLEAKLERVVLREGQSLQHASCPAAHVHFVASGLVSLMARCPRGRRIEVGLIGPEGAAGIAALLDSRAATSVVDAVVLVSGSAWRIATSDLAALLEIQPHLRDHVLDYVHTQIGEIVETMLATGHAKIENRLARWLVMASDRCGVRKLPVTHEQLSRALAVRRSGITIALHILESRHLIRSQRKLVEILDRDGLMEQIGGLHGWTGCPRAEGGTPVGPRDQENQTAG
jgi:CRP-like cAMP-binding protein